MVNLRAHALASLLLSCMPLLAQADCLRALRVPVAPIGLAVTVNDGEVGGIYPDLLRAEMAKTGCAMEFQVMQRSRQEMLFETGQADLLVPARRSARRDAHGEFVPMIRSRAVLLYLRSRQLPAHSVAGLLEHRELRVAVVRGYDYDGRYPSLVRGGGAAGGVCRSPVIGSSAGRRHRRRGRDHAHGGHGRVAGERQAQRLGRPPAGRAGG